MFNKKKKKKLCASKILKINKQFYLVAKQYIKKNNKHDDRLNSCIAQGPFPYFFLVFYYF